VIDTGQGWVADRPDGESAAIGSFADLVATVLAAPARLGPVRIVAVDGRAGAGKSTFARRLAEAARGAGVTVEEVHTDDLLAGWTDITSFWSRLRRDVLEPLAVGRSGAYHRYDWEAGRFLDEPVVVAVPDVLVVEGVTSLAAVERARTTLAVGVVAPRDVRLCRGIARDGQALRSQWLRWMAEEDDYFAAVGDFRSSSDTWPDLVIDGVANLWHDAERQYLEVRAHPRETGQ
jgi:hypothetical protein